MNPREKWRLLAEGWMSLAPPAAPSVGDIEVYIGSGEVTSKSRVLLLGCTPALRQALTDSGAEFASVDFTLEMLRKSLMIHPQPPAELVVNADWLDLPFRSNQFDCVLGDKVMGNVMPEQWPSWFASLQRVTREGATVVTRVTLPGAKATLGSNLVPFADRLDSWARFVSRGDMDVDEAVSGLWEECMTASTEWVSDGVGTQSLARTTPENLKQFLAGESPSAAQVNLLDTFERRFWPSRHASWSAYTLDGIQRTADPWFEITDVLHAQDYSEAVAQPLVVLRRRAAP